MITRTALLAAATIAAATVVAQGAVDTVSLLASGTTSYSNNTTNTVFSLTDIQPAGSGVFDPFKRIQTKDKDGNEQGYNTTNPADSMDGHPNGPAEPLIKFNTVVDKNRHINLALDYNEPGREAGGTSTIILEDLRLVVSTNAAKVGPAATDPWTQLELPADAGDVELYRMINTTDKTSGNNFNILMDANDNLASGNGGSGQADLLVRIDLTGIDLSAIYDGNHYLYVYTRYSNADSGYEEWRIQKPTGDDICVDCGGEVPEPASLSIIGLGAAGLLFRRRKVA